MKNHTINLEKTLAGAIVAIGFTFSSGLALADDPGQGTMTASSTTSAATPRPIVISAMTTGGLRRGDVMMITPGRTEVLSPAKYAQQVFSAPKIGAEACATF